MWTLYGILEYISFVLKYALPGDNAKLILNEGVPSFQTWPTFQPRKKLLLEICASHL